MEFGNIWAPGYSPAVERVVWSPLPTNGTTVQCPGGPGRLVESACGQAAVLLNDGRLMMYDPALVTILGPAPSAGATRKRGAEAEFTRRVRSDSGS